MKILFRIIKNNIWAIIIGIFFGFTVEVFAASISSDSVSYSNSSKTTQTTAKGALDELFEVVNINEKLGSTNISSIGDGTVTGAISSLNTNMNTMNSFLSYTSISEWQYRPLGDNLYLVQAQIQFDNFAITSQYGNLYFSTLTIDYPSLPFDTNGKIYWYNANAYSGNGLLNLTLASFNSSSIVFYVSDSKSETTYITLNISLLVQKKD